jgi:uncharacterized repeat protein (TIGR01451 family)
MKKFLSTFIMIFSGVLLYAQSYNPYVNQGIVTPSPLLPLQFNGTGVCSFNVGNTGSDAMPHDPGNPNNDMILKISLASGVPNVNPLDPVTALNALGGTWVNMFSWSYNVGTNTYTATQSQTIPGSSVGTITIQYKVTQNTYQGGSPSPHNGFDVNLTPPPYTNASNTTDDDKVSSYTYVINQDFGDAPLSYGSASHVITWGTASTYIYMGSTVDPEISQQYSGNAAGDDNGLTDDEDGVTLPTFLRGAQNVTIPVVINVPAGSFGFLYAWIDWMGTGNFTDPSVGSYFLFTFTSGIQTLNFTVNVPANAITSAPTFARFRVSTSSISGPSTDVSNGEVEDYQIQIQNSANLYITKTDGSSSFGPGNNTVYTVVVGNSGPDPVTAATVNDVAPVGTTISGWTTSVAGGATVVNSSGTGDIVNEPVNIPAGGTITYYITVAIPCNYSAPTLVNTATVTPPSTITDPDPNNNSVTDTDNQNVWLGITSDWNTPSNWTIGVPSCSPSVGAVIPQGTPHNPVIATTGNFTASLNIQNGAQLIINPGKDLTVCGCTEINGPCGLKLLSDELNGNASFVTSQSGTISYPNGGTACVDLWLRECVGYTGCWHYISSPVVSATAGVFNGDYMKSFDELTGTWSDYMTHSGTPLNPLQGYIVSNPTAGIRTFQGQLNDGTMQQTLLRHTTSARPGWNLVGNPYPSEIDLNTTLDWTNVDKVVYYYDMVSGNYLAYLANPYGFGLGTRYVPSMQGFFVHVYDGGPPDYNNASGIIKFTDDNRTTIGTVTFYKDLPDNLLMLEVNGNNDLKDQAIIYFNPELSSGFDQDLDAVKLAGAMGSPQLYAVASDNTQLTIDGLAFEGINTTVPLEFYVNNATGNYSITASKLESFRPGTQISLEDKKSNTTQVLNTNPTYNFSYSEGDDPARFLLHFHNPYFGIEDKRESQQCIIYSQGNNIYIKDPGGKELKGTVRVINLIGQVVATLPISGGDLKFLNMNLDEGYYIVEVINQNNTYHSKVYITR